MLSVKEAARELGVTPSRVRALIKAGQLFAVKNGREWVLREEDVLARLTEAPRAGRPRRAEAESRAAQQQEGSVVFPADQAARAHDVYDECRRMFGRLPSAELMAAARSKEEASFYMAAFDFFLQQRQRELVREGVF
ncbi:helix-turn-helix domain-containing protein [Adlercreutzia sp. R7]|uniref:Helix-turn-helix domain-containing protein n=1 Tax=Adlercreutzia wanghongyangiae TaxID=3111451 RepID=A0ABU6IF99_9ACTN|nr:helix-turn-helix domain-containing protein [Adlercreutzia sp. R7]